MGISGQVLHHLRYAAHGLFGIHQPLFAVKNVFKLFPVAAFRNLYFSISNQFIKTFQEIAFVKRFHHLVRKQVAITDTFLKVVPTVVVVGSATAHYAVNMRMERKLLSPGMQHGCYGGSSPQPLGIVAQGKQAARSAAEEQLKQSLPVAHHQYIQLVGQGKHHMKILHRQQFIHPCFLPFILLLPVARRAMAVTATVVAVMNMPAPGIITLKMMITQCSSAAVGQICKHLVRKRINVFSPCRLPDDLLNRMAWFQSSRVDFGILAIWSSSLKSSSNGLTIRFRLDVCRWR